MHRHALDWTSMGLADGFSSCAMDQRGFGMASVFVRMRSLAQALLLVVQKFLQVSGSGG